MAVRPSGLQRNLFVAILVLMTFLPLVVYFYSRERGKALATQQLVEHVEQSVNRALVLKDHLEAILGRSGAGSQAVADEMQRLAIADVAIAYIQLADRKGNVLNSTSNAPARTRVAFVQQLPLGSPDVAAPAVVSGLASTDRGSAPEFVVDLRLSPKERGHVLVGMSAEVLDEQLREFQSPARLSALQISIICVSILAVFSAYIFYLGERTRALHAQLDEESRMAYIGTLASSIAHEVRNPLSSVKMNAQMLENRLERLTDPEEREYFRAKVVRIKGEVDRLEESISHFLAFARPAPLQLESTALNQAVGEVLDLLEPQCQARGLRLARKLARGLPPVLIDPRQFAQVVQNLVLNAVQALERGGTITVQTSAADQVVSLTVADDGPGIPPEIQDKVFDVFFTTREGGTGLGLNIVYRIVEEHGGKLALESRPGDGTSFRIDLPAHADQPSNREGE